jgi:proline iminopeptidase
MPPTDLFPPIEPFTSGHLAVELPHTLYWEISGNRDGVPVVFLHGGPGAGSTPTHRRFFDPGHWKIIVFDQRGAGRSTPLAETQGNTTDALVADLERLREHLGVERWLLFGGSWGSTLALAYGMAHPQRCLGFVLRGIFLNRASEVGWFINGMNLFFPEAWGEFREFLAPRERDDILASYHRRLTDPDPAVHLPAARAWSRYEAACSTLLPTPDPSNSPEEDRRALGLARLEAHYMVNEGLPRTSGALARINRVRQIPATIIQGRYDVICPIVTANDLARAWPEAEYIIVPDAGHSALEPGIRTQLVAAVERMRRRISP